MKTILMCLKKCCSFSLMKYELTTHLLDETKKSRSFNNDDAMWWYHDVKTENGET